MCMGGEKGKKKETYIQNELIFLKLCLNTKQTSLNQNQQPLAKSIDANAKQNDHRCKTNSYFCSASYLHTHLFLVDHTCVDQIQVYIFHNVLIYLMLLVIP